MNNKNNDLSDKMFLNANIPEQKNQFNKKILLILTLVLGICSLIIAIIIMLTLGNDYNGNKEKSIPIPLIEDLNFTEDEHRQFSRYASIQSMVLATNNGLPLESNDQVVLFGSGTNNTIYGGGSIYNKGTFDNIVPIMVLEGIENKIRENKNRFIYIKNEIGYEIGKSDINENKTLSENDIESFSKKIEGAKRSVAIMTISRIPVEFNDIPDDKSSYGIQLSDSEIETYNLLNKYFDHIVLVLNIGSFIELNNIEKDKKTSILICFYPGFEGGNAIADVLLGDENPSGHLSVTWAKKIEDYPTTKTFLESQKYVKYKEGLFVGYRYFEDDEQKQSKVIFPFGHGLSYTKFDLENKAIFENGNFIINSKVTNIGKKSGKHVVQIYVRKPQNSKFIKVERELIAFAKTKELKAGESETLNIKFNLNDLASFDDTGVTGNRACYILEKGNYQIYIGNSVADTRNPNNLIYTYIHNKLIIVKKLTNKLVPQDPDVFDSNIKPYFENFINNENKKQENNIKEKILISLNDNNDKDRNAFSEFPTNIFNEINFKTVLQKKYKMEQLVDSMTNEELAFLSYGKKNNIRGGKVMVGGFYNSGLTGKYNIPSGDILENSGGLTQSEIIMSSTSWPSAIALASSFDVDLIVKIGEKIGKEARKIKSSFWLSPGLNIHRNPLCGKNYEYFSEDPILAGKMGSALTKGIQSKRISIVLRSLAFDNKVENSNGEYDRSNLAIDSRMSERVAREIYLKPFELAIKEGNPWAIMTSNNRINNMKTSESYELITSILRDEWEYKGVVMSGWYSNSIHDREVSAGISVKLPNNNPQESQTILDGLKKGTISRMQLKKNILYLFNTLSKTASIDSLFNEPENKIIIKDEKMKIKIMDFIYRKSNIISYDKCDDEDGGYYPINTITNSWISFFIFNDKEQFRRVRIRYSSALDGFGIAFEKYGEILGEITNLESTGNFENWNTTNAITIKLPKGTYELTLRILGYDYSSSEFYDKGRINWFEFL